MVRILQLGTYPIQKPIHGGQIRVAQILKHYEESGVITRYIGVYKTGQYTLGEKGSFDLEAVQHTMKTLCKDYLNLSDLGLIDDYLIGVIACENEELFNTLLRRVLAFKPDFIQLEQPWLWPLYEKLTRNVSLSNVKLIYSSQNVESLLKQKILEHYNLNDVAQRMQKHILEMESKVCARASITFTVSETEKSYFQKLGARNVYVAANGCLIKKESTNEAKAYWMKRIGKSANFALFVGSAHPPNMQGFNALLGPTLGYLNLDQRVVVAGGVGSLILENDHSVFRLLNRSRIMVCGKVSDDDLSALMELASCVILPITNSGGTNLKTAEAILYGKRVIGTSVAFRGYEEYKKDKHVTIADTNKDFKEAVKSALCEIVSRDAVKYRETTYNRLSDEKYNKLLWSSTLSCMTGSIMKAHDQGILKTYI